MIGKKRSTEGRPIFASVGTGLITAVAVAMFLGILVSLLIVNGKLNENAADSITYVLLFLVSVISCCVSAAGKKRAVVLCMTTMTVIIFAMMAIVILVFDCSFYKPIGKLIAILAGGIVSCLLVTKRKRKRLSR